MAINNGVGQYQTTYDFKTDTTTVNYFSANQTTTTAAANFQVTVTAASTAIADMTAMFQQVGPTFQQVGQAAKRIRRGLPPPPPKPKPKFSDKIRQAFDKLAAGGPMKPVKEPVKLRTPGGMEILPIGGAAPEAEVKKSVEETWDRPKKKITLERTVPVRREKGGRIQDTHAGKVTLVKTTEGPEHLTRNVGIRVDAHGTNHVEIPIKDLREALDELEGK